MEIDEDREMVGIEACGGLPQGSQHQVGTAKGEVRGGGGTGGRETGGSLSVEECSSRGSYG